MGLIKLITETAETGKRTAWNSLTRQLADQWREFFYVGSLPIDILATKGIKRIDPNTSSNLQGSNNIISNGSIVAVADGQCAIIVEQGKVVELCAVPGEYIWDSSSEPSIFAGGLSQVLEASLESVKVAWRRFTFGGDTARDQRIYYFNMKEIVDNKFGTSNPIPFRVKDVNSGLDFDLAIRINGTYSFKIVDPILFYTNVMGNIEEPYMRSQIQSQLKTELLSALQPALAQLSNYGIRYSQIPLHAAELTQELDNLLSDSWGRLRGLDLISIGFNSITLPPEDEERIKAVQAMAVLKDTNMAAATLVSAQADALRAAGANEGGAMLGFLGLGMAQQAGGVNAAQLFGMNSGGQQAPPVAAANFGAVSGSPSPTWTCSCGSVNGTGNFCQSCGKPRPAPEGQWVCVCGTANTGKFCSECGAAKPQ